MSITLTRRPIASSERTARSGAPKHVATPALLGAILALALGLRVWGLSWGLPWAFHTDERHYVDRALEILRSGDPNPTYFKNPSLLTYLIAAELLLVRALQPLTGHGPDTPGLAYLLARLDSALLGTATVALLAAAGAKLFDRRVGLLAALLLALSFLHVRDSHYGVNDVPATALLTLSFLFSVRLYRQPAPRWYLLAGLAGGLATSTKYNMGFFCVPLVVAHLLAERPVSMPCPLSGRALLPLLAAALAGLVSYLVGTPYTLLDYQQFLEDFSEQYQFGNQRWLGQPLEPVPLLYLTTLLQGFGALPLGLALLGLVFAWRTRRHEALLLLAFPAAYLAFLLPKALFFPRFALPLLPFLALLAAFGLLRLVETLQPRWRPAAGALLLGLALAQPLANDLRHNWIIVQTDTRLLASTWVQANLPPGSRLKVEDYSLQDLSERRRTLLGPESTLKVERFNGTPETDDPRDFAARNVQYVVTSSFAYEPYQLAPVRRGHQESGAMYQRLHAGLEARAQLLAEFTPGVDGRELPYRETDTATPFWSLEEYARPGPTLRVYSLTPLSAQR